MGNQWGLGLQFIIATIIMVATTNTCLGDRNINSTVACFEHERLALLKFKHNVTDNYGMLPSWVVNDCCRWERVMCDGVTGHLRYLKYLNLSRNDFQGSQIPEFIGSLKQLTYLDLSKADFSGIIPHHIGNLSKLKILDLSTYYHELMSQDMNSILT
ncbi:putative non-specific serine/threonine protein kinase [Helianthus anomalus]